MEIKRSDVHIDNEENFNDIHIHEIQRAYARINNDWLLLHYKTSIGLAIFAFLIECVMGGFLMNTDMLTTTPNRFILKFIVVPSGFNFLFIALNTLVMKAKQLSQNQKIYTVSLAFVAICFVLFTVHNAFTATYYIFAIAIMLTAVYASYRLTSVTALTSIVGMVCSELFIKWDKDKTSIYESTLRLNDFLISLFILIALSFVCMVLIRYERKKNEASIQMEIERQHLERSLQVDEMTGIFNRKALHDALKNMEDDAVDNHYILAVVDIDNFKGINDNWGHHLGDRCLIEFAKILKEDCENYNIFRYGGDEFCLLFRNVDMEKAVFTCEQIQLKVKKLHIEEQPTLKLTASFGLASYAGHMNSARLFINADQALYEAKETRNLIRVFTEEPKKAVGAETIHT